MVKAIIFDCFGVLTETKWKNFISTLDASVHGEVEDLHKAFDLGYLPYSELSSRMVKLTGLSRADVDEVFINRSTYQKNISIIDLIKKLTSDYKIGILSNVGTNWIREKFLTPDEVKLFNDFTLSYEVNMAKPDPRMYLLCCKNLNIEPNEALFVDDNVNYCMAAEMLRMKSILYKDFIQFKHQLDGILANSDN